MYAIFKAGSFQFRVEKGAVVRVPLMQADEGATVEFGDVLQVSTDSGVTIGTPTVPQACVRAKVLRHGKAAKVIAYKFKRRKGFEKIKGHRQDFTEIRVEEIAVG